MTRNKWLILSLLLTFALVVASLAVSIDAKYIKQTNGLTNEFLPADSKEQPSIEESFDDHIVKKDVCVDVGTIYQSAYVRAAIVITWKNPDTGVVYYELPEADVDYEIELKLGSSSDRGKDVWVKNDKGIDGFATTPDGFYYYMNAVPKGEQTEVLIVECKLRDGVTPPEGYTLSVEIIAQVVEATPEFTWDALVSDPPETDDPPAEENG